MMQAPPRHTPVSMKSPGTPARITRSHSLRTLFIRLAPIMDGAFDGQSQPCSRMSSLVAVDLGRGQRRIFVQPPDQAVAHEVEVGGAESAACASSRSIAARSVADTALEPGPERVVADGRMPVDGKRPAGSELGQLRLQDVHAVAVQRPADTLGQAAVECDPIALDFLQRVAR